MKEIRVLTLWVPSKGHWVYVCRETTEWKHSMDLRKCVINMRSSWRNQRLLWVVLYLFTGVCMAWVGMGALTDTAWAKDHETRAYRTTLKALFYSLSISPPPNTWCFGITFANIAIRHPSIIRTPFGQNTNENIWALVLPSPIDSSILQSKTLNSKLKEIPTATWESLWELGNNGSMASCSCPSGSSSLLW